MPSACPACDERLNIAEPHIQVMLHDTAGIKFFHAPRCLARWLERASPQGPIALLPGGRVERELPGGGTRGEALSAVGVPPQRFHSAEELHAFLARPENEDWPAGALRRALGRGG